MRKVSAGDPLNIPASTFNTFIDAAKDYRERSQNKGRDAAAAMPSAGVVLVQNATNSDLAQYAVLAIQEPIIDDATNESEYKQRVALVGREPTADDAGKIAVLLEPLPAGKIGRGVVDGVVQCQVEIPDADTTKYADVTTGETGKLKASNRSGASRILHVTVDASGSFPATAWAIVRIGNTSRDDVAVFRLSEHLEQGDTSGVDALRCTSWDASSEVWDTVAVSESETVYGQLFGGVAFENESVECVAVDGKWYAIGSGHTHIAAKVAEASSSEECVDVTRYKG